MASLRWFVFIVLQQMMMHDLTHTILALPGLITDICAYNVASYAVAAALQSLSCISAFTSAIMHPGGVLPIPHLYTNLGVCSQRNHQEKRSGERRARRTLHSSCKTQLPYRQTRAEVISLLYRSLVSPATHSDSPEIGPASTTNYNQT